MAIFSFLVTSVLMFVLVKRFSKNSPVDRIIVAFGILLTLIYVFFISFYPLIQKFVESIKDAPGRTTIWKDSLRIFLDFPIIRDRH